MRKLDYIRLCPHCHGWRSTRRALCLKCQETLNSQRLVHKGLAKHAQYFCSVTSLYYFHDSPFLTHLVYILKGAQQEALWCELADTMVTHFNLFNSESVNLKNCALVPAPSRDGQPDHAYFLAKALAELLKTRSYPCLKRTGDEQQKKLNLGLRHKRHFTCNEALRPEWHQPILFVDDVITSGSTAYAAYLALGKPEQFSVWTLLQRPKEHLIEKSVKL